MNDEKRILRRASKLPAKELNNWEQGFVAGSAGRGLDWYKVVDRLGQKVRDYEAIHGPLDLADSEAA